MTLSNIEKKMKHIIKQGQKFEKTELSAEDAYQQIDDMGEPYKKEYAKELVEKNKLNSLTFYKNGSFLICVKELTLRARKKFLKTVLK